MNKTYKDFVEFVQSKYFAIKHRHADDDWEQEYFDALDAEFDTDNTEVVAHLYYWDNDTMGEVAQGILEALNEKKLLRFDCFDDDENETTVVVGIVEK